MVGNVQAEGARSIYEPAATACDDAAPNDCSLRGATIRANAAAETSTIELPAGTYPVTESVSCTVRSAAFPFPFAGSLTSLCLTKETTILGAGAASTFLDGELGTRLLYLDLDAKVEIVGVTLERGTVTGAFSNGAAVWNDGALTLRDTVVRANAAEGSGGGVYNNGTLAVFGSTFEGNLGREGGALWVQGPSSFVDSRFTDNAGGAGGALFLNRSTLVDSAPVPVSMTGSLVDGNQSAFGAILSFGADVVITNTTVSGNGAIEGPTGLGAAIRADRGTMELRNVTLTDNDGTLSGGGLSILSATFNEPIVTPTFCNTFDETPPESEVEALPPVSPAAPFTVRWSCADATSGIAGTTVFVSENGGPYEVLVDAGPDETSAEFTPEPGRLYAFYSVAADGAGNPEPEPDVADAETTTEGAGDHDLAVLAVKAPRRVALTAKRPTRSAQVKLQLQSRNPHLETIATLEQLRALATVRLNSLGACPDAEAVLREARVAKKLPFTWKPKKKLRLTYDVLFQCANDPAAGAPDYELSARASHLALGSTDAHPQDDFCPRTVSPPGEVDAFPDGKVTDRGCGAKLADRTRGGPIAVDVTGP